METRLTTELGLPSSTATGSSATYAYDPLGRRLARTVGGATTRFLYDGDQLIAETNSGGAIQAKYIYGPGIDEVLRMERGGVVSC